MKSLGVTFLAVLLPFTGQCAVEPGNSLAAVVNDTVITWQQVFLQTIKAEQELQRRYRNQPEKYAEELNKVMQDGLEALIDDQLILQDAKTTGINIPEAFIEDQIKDRIREEYGDRVSLIKDLRAKGMTYEMYRQRVRDNIIRYIMVKRNVSSAILISPSKIERYYTANVTNYHVGDQVKLRVIVLNAPTADSSGPVRKLAREIFNKIQAGTPFGEMASVYSEGSAAQMGGDWGWNGHSTLWKGLSEVAFALSPRQHSGIVGLGRDSDGSSWVYQYDGADKLITARKYSSDGTFVLEKRPNGPPEAAKDLPASQEYYLMLVEDKRPAHVKPLPDVEDEIDKELASKERNRLEEKWIKRLRAKAYVGYIIAR